MLWKLCRLGANASRDLFSYRRENFLFDTLDLAAGAFILDVRGDGRDSPERNVEHRDSQDCPTITPTPAAAPASAPAPYPDP